MEKMVRIRNKKEEMGMSVLNIDQSGYKKIVSSGEDKPNSPKRRIWPWIFLIFLLLGLGVLFYFFLTSGSGGIIEFGGS
jgi:hypothetical protein